MKIIATDSNIATSQNAMRRKNPNFKSSGGFLALSANLMEGIERQGYLASFLIQDGLGMTLPRTWTGFNRDKEITGKYNTQEGWEVFLREGMTGPYIIAVAPAVLFFTRKFCRSTNTNTNLIKRLGQSLKEFVENPNLDKAIKEDSKKFKEEFTRFNLEKFYRDTVPNDKKHKETLNFIYAEFEKLSSNDKKARNEALDKIVEKINEKMQETSPQFYELNKLYVGKDDSRKIFDSREVISALNDFAEDAILNNPKAKEITGAEAENIKNNFATKRILTNIANVVLTLTGLSLIPKIYARDNSSPGAQTLKALEEKQKQEKEKQLNKNVETDSNNEITFKGKNINSKGIFAKIGDLITKKMPEKVSELLEYTGYNFSKTMFATLSIFGLLLPRGKKAWDRAEIDEKGRRDMTEINEILLRDTVSSLSVVFAVPILTKIFVNAYENKKGFVLTNKGSAGKPAFKKFLDVINPYSQLQVLSIQDLNSIYGNIDSKSKLMNFSKFISSNGGDLEKILSESENVSLVFNENSFTLDSIRKLSKQEKNKRIIELFEKIEAKDVNAVNETISKLMKGSGNIKNNKIAQAARGFNSLPGLISTFLISPVLLGVLIPKLTYFNTRKAHEQMANERKA